MDWVLTARRSSWVRYFWQCTTSNTETISWLLARNTFIEPGYANTTTYSMGDVSYTVNDGYRRQLFTTTVQLRK